MAKDPAWLTAARAKLGTREAAGIVNNGTIIGWAKRLGMKVLGIVYNADSVPWCGVFVATCMQEAGLPSAPIAVRAMAWATYGVRLRFERLAPGAILVFQRPGGGHVGFYVGEDAAAFHVLGGNQGDRVSVMRIARERCVAARWPTDVPVIGGPVIRPANSAPLSRNEA